MRALSEVRSVATTLGRSQRRIEATLTDRTSVVATDLTSDKARTKRLLERIGIGVPEGSVAETLDGALEAAAGLGFPVLLKPLDGNEGRGISGALADAEAVRDAWPAAAAVHPRVVVERFAAGRDHRVVVVDGRVVAVAERVAAHVVGDGVRTIRALAEETNRDPRRDPERDPAAVRVPLPLDAATEAYLERQGRSLDSVPAPGERVALRGTANLSTGGTSIDRTDEIHPRNAALCELAASVSGLDIAGLDVLTPDISVPFGENGAVVVEVNAAPGIRMHTDPDVGTPRDVPAAVLDMLFPPGSEATVPVVAVTGTNGKTTTTRLVAHLVRQTGKTVGFTTTDGVYFGETLLMEGDLTGPFAADVVLSDPRVEVAVLETARGGILRAGLGFDACDVGVVLNVTADHLGLQGIDTVEQLAEVKALVAATVKPGGHAVLNADDPLVLGMRGRTPGTVVLTSVRGVRENAAVAGHLAAGGAAVVVEVVDGREGFHIREGAREVAVAAVEEVPLTVGGAARVQMENVCAAVGAAYALGVGAEQIRAGLRSFHPSPETTPGRMNVLRTARGTVVVDYAHNPAAVAGLMEFVLRLEARRRIGVVTMPGDRRDEDLHELGRLAGRLDYLVVKEHERYRRGRDPGDVARKIGAGAEAGGLAPDRWEAVLAEPAAVERALELMEEGDAVVILADETAAVLAQVERYFEPR
ncbi:MAG TPA: cyanophycin synthetase [Longimicrobium sp.]|nr:cyanophycin synthetase [Longimicrobium sp.]